MKTSRSRFITAVLTAVTLAACHSRSPERPIAQLPAAPPSADSLVFAVEIGASRPSGDFWVHRTLHALDGRLLRHDSASSVCIAPSLDAEALRRARVLTREEVVAGLPSLFAWQRFSRLDGLAPSDTALLVAMLGVSAKDLEVLPDWLPTMDSVAALRAEFTARDIPVLAWRCLARRNFYVWDARRSVLYEWWGRGPVTVVR